MTKPHFVTARSIVTRRECIIQIPSQKDMAQMRAMPAGGDEDQAHRLMHMAQTIEKIQVQLPSLSVITTDQVSLPKHWSQLLAAIESGDPVKAFDFFKLIPANDTLLQLLLAVHSREYLQQLISFCIEAHQSGRKKINTDILVTPGAFAVLIKDLATTLDTFATIHFSFGLPTHHAYKDEGRGFCLLNKTAVLINYFASVYGTSLHYIIIGTDVNRDNGLCGILMESAAYLPICHVDIFDSRVYPQQDYFSINEELGSVGKDAGQKIKCWHKENMDYFAIDLSITERKTGSIHPSLIFALQKLAKMIENAKNSGQKIVVLLPTGWDSHKDETAFCGKYVNGKMLDQTEANKLRFNDADLTFFYEKIFQLYVANKEFIAAIYWGLEGGYYRPMYEQQIQLMVKLIAQYLVQQHPLR